MATPRQRRRSEADLTRPVGGFANAANSATVAYDQGLMSLLSRVLPRRLPTTLRFSFTALTLTARARTTGGPTTRVTTSKARASPLLGSVTERMAKTYKDPFTLDGLYKFQPGVSKVPAKKLVEEALHRRRHAQGSNVHGPAFQRCSSDEYQLLMSSSMRHPARGSLLPGTRVSTFLSG